MSLLSEAISSKLFKLVHGNNLVYNACWEDPRLDKEALNLTPNDSVLVITSAGCNALSYALEGVRRGAGEILLTSMDADGTKAGYDLELTRIISGTVNVPVIASGGAGSKEHFYEAFAEGGASAALAASLFHYRELSIGEVKQYLAERNVSVRYASNR